MSGRNTLAWVAVAFAGLLLAGGISLGVRALTSSPVGLESEPITAGKELAPSVTERTARPDRPRAQRLPRPRPRPAEPVPPTPAPAPTAPAPPPVEDSGGSLDDDGSGRGRGRGRSGGDSGSDDSGGGSDDD
jgi:uncharacterized membrane protein YgcG